MQKKREEIKSEVLASIQCKLNKLRLAGLIHADFVSRLTGGGGHKFCVNRSGLITSMSKWKYENFGMPVQLSTGMPNRNTDLAVT